jgi:hypothetical protein
MGGSIWGDKGTVRLNLGLYYAAASMPMEARFADPFGAVSNRLLIYPILGEVAVV